MSGLGAVVVYAKVVLSIIMAYYTYEFMESMDRRIADTQSSAYGIIYRVCMWIGFIGVIEVVIRQKVGVGVIDVIEGCIFEFM